MERTSPPRTRNSAPLLAAQAAVAIENARLYETATRWLAAARVPERGRRTPSPPSSSCRRSWSSSRRACASSSTPGSSLIALPDARRRRSRVEAAAGARRRAASASRSSRARSKIGRVLERRRSERVDSRDRRPRGRPGASRARLGRRARRCIVPLVVRGARDRRRRRARQAGRRRRASPTSDLRLAESFAARAAIAVDLSERVSPRRATTRRRRPGARAARGSRGSCTMRQGQALTSILLGLKHLDDVVETDEARGGDGVDPRELVAATLQDVRRLAVELRPSALDDFGLVPAVERLASNLSGAVRSRRRPRGPARRSPACRPRAEKTALYRIVQEGLTYVVKHAQPPTGASITLVRKEAVSLVADPGPPRGFDPGDRARRARSGSPACASASSSLGGRLTVETSPGAGTTVVAEVHRGAPRRCRRRTSHDDPRRPRRRPRDPSRLRPAPGARRGGGHRGPSERPNRPTGPSSRRSRTSPTWWSWTS